MEYTRFWQHTSVNKQWEHEQRCFSTCLHTWTMMRCLPWKLLILPNINKTKHDNTQRQTSCAYVIQEVNNNLKIYCSPSKNYNKLGMKHFLWNATLFLKRNFTKPSDTHFLWKDCSPSSTVETEEVNMLIFFHKYWLGRGWRYSENSTIVCDNLWNMYKHDSLSFSTV